MNSNLAVSKHHIRLNVLLLVIRIFCILFLANTAYGIILYFIRGTEALQDLGTGIFNALWITHIILFLIETFLVLRIVAVWARTNYYLTSKELILTEGILIERDTSYELYSIRSVNLYQSWLGKKLNYGNIKLAISASGGYHKEIELDGVKNPREYERILRSEINRPV